MYAACAHVHTYSACQRDANTVLDKPQDDTDGAEIRSPHRLPQRRRDRLTHPRGRAEQKRSGDLKTITWDVFSPSRLGLLGHRSLSQFVEKNYCNFLFFFFELEDSWMSGTS